jgi:hypothetical protein
MVHADIQLATRLDELESKVASMEKLTKKFNRKKRKYSDEERATIRARLLAGQDRARKLIGDGFDVVITEKKSTPSVKKVVKAQNDPPPIN